MFIARLALTNFRNYAHLELNFARGLTLLQGNNACGKTNLLEAIFYLATARSPHAGAERELMRWGASEEPIPFTHVQATIEKHNGTNTSLEIVLVQAYEEQERGARSGEESRKANPREDAALSLPKGRGAFSGRVSKRIKVNGIPKRALDLLGELNAVLFLPEDVDLVFGSPGERRRYLDTTLSQIDPRYGRALSKYNQVLEQRNGLLREFRERPVNLGELSVWDKSLIEEGGYLIARRAKTIDRYNELISEIHPSLTGQREKLNLIYQPSVALTAPSSADQITATFDKQLHNLRSRELAAGLTLVGPHRDEVRFFIQDASADAMDAITYASRGQGRSIALSLKLAEVALMRAETGEEPVLLLDDVMSELDEPRRAALSQTVIDASQAIITATDLSDFTSELRSNARVLNVFDGQVIEE